MTKKGSVRRQHRQWPDKTDILPLEPGGRGGADSTGILWGWLKLEEGKKDCWVHREFVSAMVPTAWSFLGPEVRVTTSRVKVSHHWALGASGPVTVAVDVVIHCMYGCDEHGKGICGNSDVGFSALGQQQPCNASLQCLPNHPAAG